MSLYEWPLCPEPSCRHYHAGIRRKDDKHYLACVDCPDCPWIEEK